MISHLSSTCGTYILLLYLNRRTQISVGRLGQISFKRGWYAYVGSAFGPGGLAARLGRHLRLEKKYHWHIDYLRAKTSVKKIWISTAGKSLEHLWAQRLSQAGGAPIHGFGCSDCRCSAHLFHFLHRPDEIVEALNGIRVIPAQ